MNNRITSAARAPLPWVAAGALLFACTPEVGPASGWTATEAAGLRRQLAQQGFRPLSQEPVPQPIGGHIVDQAAAVRLGKAFFWDIQLGSDGMTACASCHFAAGADDRKLNTVHPGLDGVFQSGGVSGPGQVFQPAEVVGDDRVGSQGAVAAQFVAISSDPHTAVDECTPLVDPVFGTFAQVTFRASPTVIGALFFRELFWGGEANHLFNGLTIWGLTGNNQAGSITQMENSPLASQAVGPPNNGTEMACFGRRFNRPTGIAGKLLARQPLQFQRVAVDDSVLGALANPSGPGLVCAGAPCNYRDLIAQAFGPEIAAAPEPQFTMIWGEAIQAYESTLIPDQTPFDRFLEGRHNALTARQRRGLRLFVGEANCAVCHAGALLSDASLSFFQANGPLNRDGGDQGFHNLGLRPTAEDLARGDLGIFGGVPVSVSGSPFDLGAFKTPGLRNVKLTPPYFHTGGVPTLEGVVDFYARGGDFANPEISGDMQALNLSPSERRALVDFLENGLTDCRVERQRAPFDHPELPFTNRETLAAVGAHGTGHCRPYGHPPHRDDDDDDAQGPHHHGED